MSKVISAENTEILQDLSESERLRLEVSLCEVDIYEKKENISIIEESNRQRARYVKSLKEGLGEAYPDYVALEEDARASISAIQQQGLSKKKTKCSIAKLEKDYALKAARIVSKYKVDVEGLPDFSADINNAATDETKYSSSQSYVKECDGNTDKITIPLPVKESRIYETPNSSEGVSYSTRHRLNGAIGLCGNNLQISNHFRRDREETELTVSSVHRLYYRMPSTGQIKCRCKFEVLSGYGYNTSTKRGFVGFWAQRRRYAATQAVNIFARVLHPIFIPRKTILFGRSRTETHRRPATFPFGLNAGETIDTGCNIIGGAAFPKGQLVLLEFGVQTHASSETYKYQVESFASLSGLFREIEIGSTGD